MSCVTECAGETMAWFFKQVVPAGPESSTVGQRVTLSGCSMTDGDEQEDSQTSGGTSSSLLTEPPLKQPGCLILATAGSQQ